MEILLEWAYFVFGPFVTAIVTLAIWARARHLGYAIAGGTLAGVTVMWIVSGLYWASGPTLCELCGSEDGSAAAVRP